MTPYSTSLVLLRMSRASKRRILAKLFDAGHVAVGSVGLDDVLQLVSSERAVKYACKRRRPQLHRALQRFAVDGVAQRRSDDCRRVRVAGCKSCCEAPVRAAGTIPEARPALRSRA